MEGFFVLVGLALLGLVAAAPILALIALSRARRLKARLDSLQTELTVLRQHVEAFRKAPSGPPEAAPAAAARPEPPPPPVPPPVPAAAPAPPPVPPLAAAGAAPPRPEPPPAIPEPRVEPGIAPPPPPTPPPEPAAPRFDWESLLGLKGAAWLGGITLVIAGIFLAKMAYEAGFFTPTLRVAAMVLAGVGGLVWAEVSLRRGYVTTANAVSGAAIAVLYTAFYAAHAVWHLVPLGVTFAMMALVTVVAGVVAIRYDALFSALLGLLGGFATPILLSTGEDRPVSLFSYILLLNLGLMTVAVKKRWNGLVLLGLAGTFFIEAGWAAKYLTPETLTIGLPVFLIFGLLYLLLPAVAKQEESSSLQQAGAGGIAAPFLFGLFLAGSARYTGEWPLLFGYLALLDAALIAIALLRGRTVLLLGGALATGLTLPLWASQGLQPAAVWGPTLAAIGLAALLNLPARLAHRLAPQRLENDRRAYEGAGVAAAAGLALYSLILATRAAEPPWPFVTLLAALALLLLERTGPERLRFVMPVGASALALLAQIWFHQETTAATLWRNLAVPVLASVAFSLVAAWRARAPRGPQMADEDEGAAVGAALFSLFGLAGCLANELAREPLPLFASLAVYSALLVVSARRRDWTQLLPTALFLAAVFALAWQDRWFQAEAGDLAVVLPIDAAFYLAFLVLPFVLAASLAPEWKDRNLPWVTSALAGPAFFLPLYRAVSAGWGKAWIGALPLLLAAFTVAAVAGVRRRFAAAPEGTPEARRRLGFLALFSAVALGFLAVAIPLQLDRQWITVGWALEAAAVWWLFGKLPHPGLKYFGALLFACVGVRLLANPEVLRYEERGLPILNWLLYTYGVPALCCLAGAFWLKRAEAARQKAPAFDFLSGDRTLLPPAAAGLGLILLFALINLEIIDFYSTSRYVELSLERQLARDLTMSLAWGVYAMALLLTGLWRKLRGLRFLSLGFLLLTVAKVFLYDLSKLEGGYRILSFLGLGVALILVSLLYQRFILARERSS